MSAGSLSDHVDPRSAAPSDIAGGARSESLTESHGAPLDETSSHWSDDSDDEEAEGDQTKQQLEDDELRELEDQRTEVALANETERSHRQQRRWRHDPAEWPVSLAGMPEPFLSQTYAPLPAFTVSVVDGDVDEVRRRRTLTPRSRRSTSQRHLSRSPLRNAIATDGIPARVTMEGIIPAFSAPPSVSSSPPSRPSPSTAPALTPTAIPRRDVDRDNPLQESSIDWDAEEEEVASSPVAAYQRNEVADMYGVQSKDDAKLTKIDRELLAGIEAAMDEDEEELAAAEARATAGPASETFQDPEPDQVTGFGDDDEAESEENKTSDHEISSTSSEDPLGDLDKIEQGLDEEKSDAATEKPEPETRVETSESETLAPETSRQAEAQEGASRPSADEPNDHTVDPYTGLTCEEEATIAPEYLAAHAPDMRNPATRLRLARASLNTMITEQRAPLRLVRARDEDPGQRRDLEAYLRMEARHLVRVQEQLVAAEIKLVAQIDETNEAREEVAALERQLGNMVEENRSDYETLEQRYAVARSRASRLEDELEEARVDIEGVKALLKDTQREVQRLQAPPTVHDCSARCRVLQNALAAAETKHEAELDESQNETFEMETKFMNSELAVERLEDALKELRAEVGGEECVRCSGLKAELDAAREALLREQQQQEMSVRASDVGGDRVQTPRGVRFATSSSRVSRLSTGRYQPAYLRHGGARAMSQDRINMYASTRQELKETRDAELAEGIGKIAQREKRWEALGWKLAVADKAWGETATKFVF